MVHIDISFTLNRRVIFIIVIGCIMDMTMDIDFTFRWIDWNMGKYKLLPIKVLKDIIKSTIHKELIMLKHNFMVTKYKNLLTFQRFKQFLHI